MLRENFRLQDLYNVGTYGAKDGNNMLWNYKLTKARLSHTVLKCAIPVVCVNK